MMLHLGWIYLAPCLRHLKLIVLVDCRLYTQLAFISVWIILNQPYRSVYLSSWNVFNINLGGVRLDKTAINILIKNR